MAPIRLPSGIERDFDPGTPYRALSTALNLGAD
jgi:hypothetical protein